MESLCLACAVRWGDPLCARCRKSLMAGGHRRFAATVTDAGIVVGAPYAHDGSARALVHRMKYHGSERAAGFLAASMVELLPTWTTELVPVPRVALRRIRSGTDPAAMLAAALRRLTGLPVRRALRAPPWWPRHAAAPRARRRPPPLRRVGTPASGAVLVDDVVTTGTTMMAAHRISEIGYGVASTVAGTLKAMDMAAWPHRLGEGARAAQRHGTVATPFSIEVGLARPSLLQEAD